MYGPTAASMPASMSASMPADGTDILAVSVMGQPLALRFAELGGVVRLSDARRVVRLPAADPALLGVIAVRGVVMPVFSLSALLGLPGPRAHAWFAWVEGRNPVGYAFDGIDGRAWLGPEDVYAGDMGHPLLCGAARYAGTSRPLLRLEGGIRASRAFASGMGAHRAAVAA